jgi:hypothetical protein
MSGSLRGSISQLAEQFIAGVLGAIRGSSLVEILGETPSAGRRGPGRPRKHPASGPVAQPAASGTGSRRKGRRLGRRSAKALGRVVEQFAELLAKHPKGLRAEELRSLLNLSRKEMPRPLAKALESKRITKTGEKRATTYFVSGGGSRGSGSRGSVSAAPKPAKRAKRGPGGKKAGQPQARPVAKRSPSKKRGRPASKGRRGGRR